MKTIRKRILIIKNGVCDTDIDYIIKTINQSINIDIVTSSTLTQTFCIEAVNKYIGIIILGGDQTLTNRHESNYVHTYLNNLIDYIKYWIKKKIHILGICLGDQMCAE